MKTIRISFVKILTIILLALSFNVVKATNYLTIYLDSLNEDDTVTVCNSFDLIKVVPLKGLTDIFWAGFGDIENLDTTFVDTLYLPVNYKGKLTCQGYNGVNWSAIWIYICPLAVIGNNKSIFCGDSVILNTNVNYRGSGTVEYNWDPSAGLSDPKVPNPVAKVKTNSKFMVTILTPNGCQAEDSVKVILKPMNSPGICIVGVDTTDKNVVIWDKPASTSIDSFFIFKETNVTNVYKKIGSVGYNAVSAFKDTTSHPDVQSGKYKVSIKDDCGFESAKSTPHKTIHLSVNLGINDSWNLIWEPYQGFIVSGYNIYRGTSKNDLALIGSTSGSSTQFSDLTPPAGHLLYQVEVVGPSLCDPSGSTTELKVASVSTSRSNIASYNPSGIIKMENRLFSMFPNPANNQLFIESISNNVKATVEITNLEGQLILSFKINKHYSQLDIGKLNTGIYLVKIITETGVTKEKLVKR